MPKPNSLPYHRTQKAPWFLLLLAFAAPFFTIASVTTAEPVLPLILLVSGLLMAVLGFSFQYLTVADEGDEVLHLPVDDAIHHPGGGRELGMSPCAGGI